MAVSNLHQGVVAGAAQPTGAVFDTTLIPNSVWLDGSADGLTASSGTFSAQDGKEFTLGTWIQLNQMDVSEGFFCADAGSNVYTSARHDDDNKFYFQTETGSAILKTQAVFRDIGWYHVLISVDTTQSGASDRVLLYVNGIKQTLDGTQPSINHAYEFNTAVKHEVGDSFENGAFKGYLAQSFMIGSKSIQQGDFAITDFLDTFALGTHGSQSIPKKHTEIKTLVDAGSSNSFLLQYENSGALGTDSSTNTNTFTATSMAAANQSENTPSNLYPIINIIDHSNNTLPTISEGNLRSAGPGASRACSRTTIAIPTTGKWYWEAKWNSVASARIGFAESTSQLLSNCGQSALSWGIQNDGTLVNNNSSGSVLFSWSTNDIIAMAYDADASKFWFGRIPSGSTSVTWASSGNPETGANATVTSVPTEITPAIDTNTGDVSLFFPEEDWTLSPKLSGFKEINSKNLTAPDFQGIDYFDSTIYEGTGDNQRVGDFVPFTDTFAIGNSAMWSSEDIRRLRHTYSSEAAATSDNSSDSAVYRKATISFWTKFIETNDTDQQVFISAGNAAETERFQMYAHGTDDNVNVTIDPSGSDNNRNFKFAKGLLSTQAWSNVVIHLDTNNSTAADRIKIWINGNPVTSTETSRPYTAMTQGQALNLFEDEQIMIGHLTPSDTYASVYNFNSYLAEFHVIDGYNKAVSDFGQVDTSTNRWVAKDYKTNVGTYGNRGFYLKFDGTPGASAGSNMGKDSSGNNIHLTEETHGSGSAWAAADKTDDTPSNNKAILWKSASVATVSEGGLKIAATGNAYQWGLSSFAIPSSGKWVFEAQSSNIDGSSRFGYIGIAQRGGVAGSTNTGNNYLYALNLGNGEVVRNSSVVVDLGAGATTSVMRIEYDAGIDQIKIYDDNSLVHTATTHLSGHASLHFVVAPYASGTDFTVKFTDFTHTPTTDFKALIQDNLDDTASKLTAWAWIKNRDATDNHILVDRVRGIGKDIHSNDSPAQVSNDDTVMKFLQRGVQIGSDVEVNTASESYVLWQWLVGASATTGSTTSPAGSIASTSIVADAGHFSIVQYEGTKSNGTVGHGLSAAPEMIMIKDIDATESWIVGHDDIGWTKNLYLNLANSVATSSTIWQDTAPTSSVFSIGTSDGVNKTETHIAYCFRSVPGVCKIGGYEGNGSADGPYIQTGFKPRWIIIKNMDVARDWTIADTARHPSNVVGEFLYASSSAVESARGVTSGTDYDLDILSDGFKIRTVDGALNDSTLIYMAMAEIGGNGTLPPIYGR